jgi:cytochrome c oxidase cbb3-type subunit 2
MPWRRAALVGALGSALALTGLPPDVTPSSARAADAVPQVTAVVRNSLGELEWVTAEVTGYSPLEAEGRRLYLQSGCIYCHSQHARPVRTEVRPWGIISADPRRWGPPSEPGEYAFDQPPTFGTIGIAPDLARVGLKYSDEWHVAHFWNPPMITPGSIMGGFSGLFDASAEPVAIVEQGADRTLQRNETTEALFDFASTQQVKLTPSAEGVLFVPLAARGKYPLVWTPNDEFTGDMVRLVAETPEIAALTAYLQKLGTSRGMWRELFDPEKIDGTAIDLPRSETLIARGKQVYERHCIACHGVEGDGNGPAATFLHVQRPRNFTYGIFKFRLTKGPLPTDADLLRTITRGVRGTAMPAWFELPLEDRLAVIQYVKYELTVDRSDPSGPYYFFEEEDPGPALEIGTPPPPTPELLAHGKEIWQQAKCWECHGQTGRGDGEKAAGLKDDWGFPIVPANLTRGLFKSGPKVEDIFRTLTTGLAGTPMPSFRDAFPDEDRWALAYYVLSLAAYSDPLTGEPMRIVAPSGTERSAPRAASRAAVAAASCGVAPCAVAGLADAMPSGPQR